MVKMQGRIDDESLIQPIDEQGQAVTENGVVVADALSTAEHHRSTNRNLWNISGPSAKWLSKHQFIQAIHFSNCIHIDDL